MKCMKNQNEEKKTGDDSVVLPLIQDNATSTGRVSIAWSTPEWQSILEERFFWLIDHPSDLTEVD